MATKPPPKPAAANGSAKAAQTDLSVLWESAVTDYEQRTGKSLRLAPWRSMQEVIDGTENQVNNFKDFRHSGTKVDKVRTAFSNNLWLIQKVVNVIQIVGTTAAAFPPAMPAALIFNAFGQVMTSFNQMSADYDKVIGFFEFTQRFLDRLSMIEGHSPEHAPFQRCITRVFSSMLTICAVAQEYAKEKRFKKWFNTLVEGSDSGLAGAYKDMENAINEMSQAVNLATLRTVQILAEIVKSMEEGVEFIVTKTTFIDERTQRIETKVDLVINQGQVIESKQDAALAKQDVGLAKTDTVLALMRKLYERDGAGYERTQEKDPKGHPGQRKGKGKVKTEPGEKKWVALNQVSSYLSQASARWSFISKETKAQRKEIQDESVPGTGSWLLNEDNLYKAWADHKRSIVWLVGSAGIGKSFVAEAVVASLEASSEDRKSLAYFFFKEEEDNLRSFTESLYCMSYQLAEADPKYCEQLASELSKEGSSPSNPWQRLFANRFPSKGDDHAYLILDGIDEMKATERVEMIKCLNQVVNEDLNIHVLLSGRPSISALLESLSPSIIEISRTKLLSDIERVIIQNLKKLPRIKNFRKPVRSYILSRVKASADGMRYVDHMLRRLNMIGREKAVLKDLEKNLPKSLEELYDLMLRECQQNRTKEQYLTLKKLFAWLAYSKRSLTLDEGSELIDRTIHEDHTFDIEDEIIGRSARILELVRTRDGDDDDHDNDDKGSDSDNGIESVEVDMSGSGLTPLAFQERSLREYFQAVDVDENGLRTPPSAAHLNIFEMATDLLISADVQLKDTQQPKLLSYAASFWAQHFVEIDLSKASDEEVKHVVNILYKIMTNHRNVARVFEHFSEFSYSEMTPEKEGLWLNNLKEWTSSASKIPGLLDPEVDTWAKAITTSQEPMMTLARGHVINWYAQNNGWRILKAFTFARDAFKLSNLDVSENTLESVRKVADHFPDFEKTAGAMRAISASLAGLELYEDSIKYVNQGLEMLGSDESSLRFYLRRSLAMSYAATERMKEAVQEVEKAIDALPNDWKDDEELVGVVEWIYKQQGDYLNALECPQEAIEAYQLWRAVNPQNTVEGYYLDDVARVWNELRDPDGSRLFGLLRDWTEKERLSWFEYIYTYHDISAIARFDEVAAQNGEDGKSFLLQCYHNYMATIPTTADKIIFIWADLAATYQAVIKDRQKAKELYIKVLSRPITDVDLRGSVNETLFQVRRALAEIIFEEFHKTSDPAQKVKLLEQMKNFPSQSTDANDSFEIESSNVSVMIALMHRVLGQPIDFETVMNKTFDICVNGLSDSIGGNDSSSFRLLAKVLACLEGLERDALMALSCQYSKVTDESEDEDEDETKAAQGDSGSNLVEQDSEVQDIKGELLQADNTPRELAVNRDGSNEKKESNGHDEPQSQPEHNHSGGQIHYTETTILTTTVEDGVLKDSNKVIIEEASIEPARETDIPDTTEEPVEELPRGLYDDEETLTPNADEEFGGGGGLSCDGECGRSWTQWEVPIYFCLLCTNTDLCPTCYKKRIAQNNGEGTKYWRPYCGETHRYAKGPIKGWRGVKGGLMRIEGDDDVVEELSVQDWLKELKNVRWDAAWKTFWTRLEGVKDIGF